MERSVNPTIRRLGEPGDLGWVVMAQGEVYFSVVGWDTSCEALVAQIVADFARDVDPAREAARFAVIAGCLDGCRVIDLCLE